MSQSTRTPLNRRLVLLTVALLVTGVALACNVPTRPAPTDAPNPGSPTAQVPPTTESTPGPTPTPTPEPPKELTVCQSQEPNTLFVYGAPSQAARNVMAAVYDGPIDLRGYRPEPVILEQVPSLERGDAALRTVVVREGDRVLDAAGDVVELVPQVPVQNSAGDEVVYEGGELAMTQLVVTFTLRADVTWADGQPLTADDSLFGYEVASALDDPALEWRVARAASYEALDDRTVVWTGVPGYRDTYYFLNLYHPLPRHAMADIAVEAMGESQMVTRQPLGWGPFVIEEWIEGDRITLLPNPNYYRASEGFPALDRVTFRFLDDAQQATEELLSGGCDLLTRDLIGDVPPESLLQGVDAGQARLISWSGSEWEHLDFGIEPATWTEQPVFFADARVRQAVAQCTDRERIARDAFPYAEAVLAHSYVPPQHPVYAAEQIRFWPYDPAAGRALLEEAGYADTDGDGILEAQAVSGIASGTPLSVTLLTTAGDPPRQRASTILDENLAACGIALATEELPPEVFYADGPDGPVFGRNFELALFSWLNGIDAPCDLYLSSAVPSPQNWWATSNNPGYRSEAYDQACRAAVEAFWGTEAYVRHHQEAQAIFSRDVPVLPLYFVPRVMALRPEVRGVSLDPSQETPFWGIEEFDIEW